MNIKHVVIGVDLGGVTGEEHFLVTPNDGEDGWSGATEVAVGLISIALTINFAAAYNISEAQFYGTSLENMDRRRPCSPVPPATRAEEVEAQLDDARFEIDYLNEMKDLWKVASRGDVVNVTKFLEKIGGAYRRTST